MELELWKRWEFEMGIFYSKSDILQLATENEQLKSSARPNFIRKFNKSITLTDWAVPAYSLQIKTTFNSAGKIFQPFFVCLYVVGMVVVLRKCLLAKTCLHEQEIILLPEKQTLAFFGDFFLV